MTIPQELTDLLTQKMLCNVSIGVEEPERNSSLYDECGWYVEVFYEAQMHDCHVDGDGYDTPWTLCPGYYTGEVTGIDICFLDENDDQILIPEDEINRLEAYLQYELDKYLSRL